jgi:hypothetical protein
MAKYVADCPRCRASKVTFDVLSSFVVEIAYDWQRRYEAFCRCRHCSLSTTLVIAQKLYDGDDFLKENPPHSLRGGINDHFETVGYISLKDTGATGAPDHVPPALMSAPSSIDLWGSIALRCLAASSGSRKMTARV